jgi:hypothetical protein
MTWRLRQTITLLLPPIAVITICSVIFLVNYLNYPNVVEVLSLFLSRSLDLSAAYRTTALPLQLYIRVVLTPDSDPQLVHRDDAPPLLPRRHRTGHHTRTYIAAAASPCLRAPPTEAARASYSRTRVFLPSSVTVYERVNSSPTTCFSRWNGRSCGAAGRRTYPSSSCSRWS